MSTSKIALFGGTFDPIHFGHTKVAVVAAEHIGAETVFFIPARCSALKYSPPQAGDDDRFKMIELAISDDHSFRVSDCELKRAAPSFTLDTIRYFRSRYGEQTELFWLLGADAVEELHRWHKIKEIIDECNLSVMYRAGFDPPDFTSLENSWGKQRVQKLRENVIKTPLVNISSTQVRERIARGLDVSDMLHPSVVDYINERSLYRAKSQA